MYSILIVDDERTERLGIEKLILKYGYELEILQASNGEQALEIFNQRHIDILLTDIKMPFMTGIELIRQLRQNAFDPICIIYSAYGEFEYAQDAISLGVFQYLLKPIKLDEFKKLFDGIFKNLDEKQLRTKENSELKLELENVKHTSKINSLIRWFDNEYSNKPELLNEGESYIPIVFSSYSNIFSKYWDSYEAELYKVFGENSIIINKNDIQIIVLLKNFNFDAKILSEKCEKIIETSVKQYKSDMFIVIGLECSTLDELRSEYNKIYEQLDYQFFASQSMVFVCDENSSIKRKN